MQMKRIVSGLLKTSSELIVEMSSEAQSTQAVFRRTFCVLFRFSERCRHFKL